jgi:transposase
MTKRRSFSDKFKATVALEALRGDRTAQEIAAQAQSPSNPGDDMEAAGD